MTCQDDYRSSDKASTSRRSSPRSPRISPIVEQKTFGNPVPRRAESGIAEYTGLNARGKKDFFREYIFTIGADYGGEGSPWLVKLPDEVTQIRLFTVGDTYRLLSFLSARHIGGTPVNQAVSQSVSDTFDYR